MQMEEEQEEVVLANFDREFKKYLSNPENVENAANSLVDDLIADAIISVVFEVDIQRKTHLSELAEGDSESWSFELPAQATGDIFGHSISEKGHECACPCCNRTISSSRFAPHLAKCMGMGRNSSRIARTRIASNANKETGGTSSCAVSDDEDDADWTVMTEKKGKRKKEKSNVKKIKLSNKPTKNGSASEGNLLAGSTNITYENMSERDRRALLSQICGVVSEHTKKVCTKSSKCPQHSEDQKRAVRDLYLTDSFDSCVENLQIDVDTCEEEGEINKESLARSWEAENSNTSSPADSASTSSSSSKKRDKNSFKLKNKD